MMRFRAGVSEIALVAIAFACNAPAPMNVADGGDDAGDASAVLDVVEEPFVTTPHAPPPLIPSNGGNVLASAHLVVVTFAGYAFADDMEAMADWVGASSWLAAVGAQYGVGTPTVTAKVRLAESAPAIASASDFTAYVASKVGAEVPAPSDPSTFYAFIFPSGAQFDDPSIGAMCDTFTGYHDAAAKSAYAFAAIGTCPNHVAGLADVEQVERVFSHELIEALTDPFGDGFAARDPDDPWSYVSGGELADVCNGWIHETGFLAVRSWSNASAAAGLDPCEPNDASAIYFGVAASSQTAQHISVGNAATLSLTGFSAKMTTDWTLQIAEGASAFVPDVKLATTTMNDGVTAQMTLGVPSSAAPGSTALVLVRSLHAGDTAFAVEPVVVFAE